MRYRTALPQLEGNLLLTDGGMETTLVFHRRARPPGFAAFPLLETEEGRAALTRYFEPTSTCRQHGPAVLEAPTWRANPAWGTRLG